jgi:GxxExxY protein
MDLIKTPEDVLSRTIIDAAIETQRELGGPGLLESIYEEALAVELSLRGLPVSRQQSVPVRYKDTVLSTPLRLDMLVSGLVIVECKSVEKLHHNHLAQTLTYLKATRIRLALVINFGQMPLRPGIRRVVNNLRPSQSP